MTRSPHHYALAEDHALLDEGPPGPYTAWPLTCQPKKSHGQPQQLGFEASTPSEGCVRATQSWLPRTCVHRQPSEAPPYREALGRGGGVYIDGWDRGQSRRDGLHTAAVATAVPTTIAVATAAAVNTVP